MAARAPARAGRRCSLVAATRLARPPRPRRRHPPRTAPAPPAATLRHASDLAFRLQRGAWLGWAAGYAILGAAFGSIANDIGNVIGDSADVRDALTKLGGTHQLSDAYLAATLQIMALVAAGYAIQATLRLRARGDLRPRRAAARHRDEPRALGVRRTLTFALRRARWG